MNEHLYAYLVESDKKTLVSINDCCEEDRSKTFVCPGCGGEMGLRLGNVRIHHFYHKTECNCPGETYKHMLTKELFKRYFDSSETMLVNNKYKYECEHVGNCEVIELWKEVKRVKNQIPASCQTKYKDNVFDLKKYYTTASIEKHEDKYIADVLLTGDKVPDMLVEIKVTHKCTEDKQSSGHKIIEFDVSGIEESEIEKKFKYVADKVLTFDEAFPVKFYGMKKTDGLPPKREFITNLSKHGSKFWAARVETCSCEEYKRRAELFLPNERKAREQKRIKRELKKKRELEYADQQKAMEEFRKKFEATIPDTLTDKPHTPDEEEKLKHDIVGECPKKDGEKLMPLCEFCLSHRNGSYRCLWSSHPRPMSPLISPGTGKITAPPFEKKKPRERTVRKMGDDGMFYYEIVDEDNKTLRRYRIDEFGNRVYF